MATVEEQKKQRDDLAWAARGESYRAYRDLAQVPDDQADWQQRKAESFLQLAEASARYRIYQIRDQISDLQSRRPSRKRGVEIKALDNYLAAYVAIASSIDSGVVGPENVHEFAEIYFNVTRSDDLHRDKAGGLVRGAGWLIGQGLGRAGELAGVDTLASFRRPAADKPLEEMRGLMHREGIAKKTATALQSIARYGAQASTDDGVRRTDVLDGVAGLILGAGLAEPVGQRVANLFAREATSAVVDVVREAPVYESGLVTALEAVAPEIGSIQLYQEAFLSGQAPAVEAAYDEVMAPLREQVAIQLEDILADAWDAGVFEGEYATRQEMLDAVLTDDVVTDYLEIVVNPDADIVAYEHFVDTVLLGDLDQPLEFIETGAANHLLGYANSTAMPELARFEDILIDDIGLSQGQVEFFLYGAKEQLGLEISDFVGRPNLVELLDGRHNNWTGIGGNSASENQIYEVLSYYGGDTPEVRDAARHLDGLFEESGFLQGNHELDVLVEHQDEVRDILEGAGITNPDVLNYIISGESPVSLVDSSSLARFGSEFLTESPAYASIGRPLVSDSREALETILNRQLFELGLPEEMAGDVIDMALAGDVSLVEAFVTVAIDNDVAEEALRPLIYDALVYLSQNPAVLGESDLNDLASEWLVVLPELAEIDPAVLEAAIAGITEGGVTLAELQGLVEHAEWFASIDEISVGFYGALGSIQVTEGGLMQMELPTEDMPILSDGSLGDTLVERLTHGILSGELEFDSEADIQAWLVDHTADVISGDVPLEEIGAEATTVGDAMDVAAGTGGILGALSVSSILSAAGALAGTYLTAKTTYQAGRGVAHYAQASDGLLREAMYENQQVLQEQDARMAGQAHAELLAKTHRDAEANALRGAGS